MIDTVNIFLGTGIYCIINDINNKMYIGSAVNLKNRKEVHISLLKHNKHHSIILQRALNKYGENNFSFELIEYVYEKKNLIEREQLWIDFFKPYYNICKIAGSSLGVKRSNEAIFKNSKAKKNHIVTQETRLIISQTMTGMKPSLETINKMKKPKSEEAKKI